MEPRNKFDSELNKVLLPRLYKICFCTVVIVKFAIDTCAVHMWSVCEFDEFQTLWIQAG